MGHLHRVPAATGMHLKNMMPGEWEPAPKSTCCTPAARAGLAVSGLSCCL